MGRGSGEEHILWDRRPPPDNYDADGEQAPKTAPCSATRQQHPLSLLDGSSAGYETKLEELDAVSQHNLRQIDEWIHEYKDESQTLDHCCRLYDSSVHTNPFELDARCISQDLEGISIAIKNKNASVKEMVSTMKDVIWNADAAVRSYMRLRLWFLHPKFTNASSIGPPATNRPTLSSIAPVYDFYSGLPNRPSSFIKSTSVRFENCLTECCKCIEELELLVLIDPDKAYSSSGPSLESIPKVLSNNFDFMMYLVNKVENLHHYVESKKKVYLADRRRWGDWRDPFLEADNRDAHRQEVASTRVHPTLHFPAIPARPSCQHASAPSSFLLGSGFSHQSIPVGTDFRFYLGPAQAPSLFVDSVVTTVDFATPASDVGPKDPRSSAGAASTSRRKSRSKRRMDH